MHKLRLRCQHEACSSYRKRSAELVKCRFRPQYVPRPARPSSKTGGASSFALLRFDVDILCFP
eukprot:3706234-Pleurochrysis_carterae.AAC.2